MLTLQPKTVPRKQGLNARGTFFTKTPQAKPESRRSVTHKNNDCDDTSPDQEPLGQKSPCQWVRTQFSAEELHAHVSEARPLEGSAVSAPLWSLSPATEEQRGHSTGHTYTSGPRAQAPWVPGHRPLCSPQRTLTRVFREAGDRRGRGSARDPKSPVGRTKRGPWRGSRTLIAPALWLRRRFRSCCLKTDANKQGGAFGSRVQAQSHIFSVTLVNTGQSQTRHASCGLESNPQGACHQL